MGRHSRHYFTLRRPLIFTSIIGLWSGIAYGAAFTPLFHLETYGAVSLPILGLDVSTFYGRRYLCANLSWITSVARIRAKCVNVLRKALSLREFVMDNVCREDQG